MLSLRTKNVIKYVVPTIFSGVCFFLFTVVDAVFVGRGIGTNALGAMSLLGPFVMVIGAVNMLINIGGVTIFAIRIGKGDVAGANKVFSHGMILMLCISIVLSFSGMFFTNSICTILGAGETFHHLAAEYLFWYSLFIIPSALSRGLQNYCRNDGAPGLVVMVRIVSTRCTIIGGWLLIYPIAWGTKGAAIATGVS